MNRFQGDIRFSTEIKDRTELPHLCAASGLLGAACEVGVHLGDFASWFLSHWPGRRYYAVDSYLPHPDVPGDRKDHRQAAHTRLAPFQDRVVWMETDSQAALEVLPKESLDFCYIDADHGFQRVRAEIAAAWLRIRPGGILAGHDYAFTHPGVVAAVREFSERHAATVWITEDDNGPWSWYCFKR